MSQKEGDDVTSDPDSEAAASIAPGQPTSKRSNTRSNRSKGPVYNKRNLEKKAKEHHRQMGRGAHEGQLQKAQLFTGLKGEEALTAY